MAVVNFILYSQQLVDCFRRLQFEIVEFSLAVSSGLSHIRSDEAHKRNSVASPEET